MTQADRNWILIVDDHPLFCDALELTMQSVCEGAQTRTAHSLSAALETIARHGAPRMILLDLNLPDVSGLDGALSLQRAVPDTPLLIVSSLTDPRIVSSALAAGARAYVPKHSPRSVFSEAVEKVASGGIFTPVELGTRGQTAQAGEDAVRRLRSLTGQQARILKLICEGKLNKQIAFELSIAETTVKAHVTAIMRKLGVQSRTQAVLVAQDASFGSILPDS